MKDKNWVLDHTLKVKTEDLTFQMHEYNIDLKSNHIYLFGSEEYAIGMGSEPQEEPGIEYTIANKFIRNLNLCMRANPEKPILIHMKTCGGSWEEGMAIYDAIKSCPSPITILNYTHARSMSSIIFQAANKRVMMPTSYFMFHDGTLDVGGTVKSVKSLVEFYKRAEVVMLDIYVHSMVTQGKFKGQKAQLIKKWLRSQMDKKEEVYLSAEETVALGLADEVFSYNWSALTEYTEEQLKD